MSLATRSIEPMQFSVVVILPDDHPAFAGGPRKVRYCNACRRWGALHAAHICNQNWYPGLDALLAFEGGLS